MIIGGRVRQARLVRQITSKELAEEAGCSPSLISAIENGHKNPSPKTIQAIATVLEVPVRFLQKPMPKYNLKIIYCKIR